MSTTRVNRYTTTDTSYTLQVGLQQTNTSRPGSSNSNNRKAWDTSNTGYNEVTLHQLFSPPNYSPESQQSVIGLKERDDDPILITNQGIPASQCKATFTGSAVMTISGPRGHRYDSESIYYTERLDGLYISNSSWKQTYNNVNSVVYDGNKGLPSTFTFASRTLQKTGSAITMTTANRNQLTTGNNLSKVNIAVAFHSNSSETFQHRISHTGTLVRTWEANNHTIDGIDGDVNPISGTAFILAEDSAMRRLAEADLTAQATITEVSINKKFASATATVSSSLSVTPSFKVSTTENLLTSTVFIASTDNLVLLPPQSFTAVSSVNLTPTFKPGAEADASALFTSTATAGMIYNILGEYSWETFNLNTYFELGYVQTDYVNAEGEYTWQFLENNDWDNWPTETWTGNEQSWDNWPYDVWERDFILPIASSMTLTTAFKHGDIVTYNNTFTLDEDVGINEALDPLELTSAFTTDFTAVGQFFVTVDIGGAFTPSLIGNIIDVVEPITISGAFNTVLTANATTDILSDVDTAFTISVTPTFKPGPTPQTYTAQAQVEINPRFKPSATENLQAFGTSILVARLFFSADPYNIYTVEKENRTAVVTNENRQTKVDQENRVNIIATETRTHLVPEETRKLKLVRPPFSNRYSIPRVRAEA